MCHASISALFLPSFAMKALSRDKVNSVTVLLRRGVSVKKVAKQLKLSSSTVSKYKNIGGLEGSSSAGGRERKISEAKLRILRRDILSGELKTAEAVRTRLVQEGYGVSYHTVIRALKSLGFVARLKKKKPFMSAKNRAARLKWAKEHQHWTVKDWERVVFTDETKINVWGSDGVRYCWIRPGDPLRPHHLNLTVKHGGGSLMMWGCLTAKGIGYGFQVEESIDSRVYQEVLEKHLKDSLEYYGLVNEDFVFQQDNAPCHTSSSTTAWLERQGYMVLP